MTNASAILLTAFGFSYLSPTRYWRGRGKFRTWRQLVGSRVEAIESFVSQNIEELSDFAGDRVAQNMKLLLDKYNERVAEVETDLSLENQNSRGVGEISE